MSRGWYVVGIAVYLLVLILLVMGADCTSSNPC
jgi:hypothetical protein